jgi:hypothetical protein
MFSEDAVAMMFLAEPVSHIFLNLWNEEMIISFRPPHGFIVNRTVYFSQ